MVALEFRNVSKTFRQRALVRDMNLQIRENSFSVIFGAPGSGKSTLLRLITGLEKPDRGEIYLNGKSMNGVSPGDRNIGYVPQSFALYPHYSVFDNIAYPLKLMGVNKGEYTPIVEQTAKRLQITHLLNKRPDQCSGGEKQRVAIARGIVKNTRVFILDDPLTGLDFKLRERLFDDLRQMKDDLNATFIYTTSDPLEALMLAEDIHIFEDGKIIESGDLNEVYRRPNHLRAISMLSFPEANVFSGNLHQQNGHIVCRTEMFEFPVQFDSGSNNFSEGQEVKIVLRPQDVRLTTNRNNGLLTSDAEITLVEDLGSEMVVYIEAQGTPLVSVIRHGDGSDPTEGAVTIGIAPQSAAVYAADSQLRIGQGGV
jgi:ABC-type sugar transport system ATPase subunit